MSNCVYHDVVDRHKAEADRVAELRGRQDEEVWSAEVIRMLLYSPYHVQRFPSLVWSAAYRAQPQRHVEPRCCEDRIASPSIRFVCKR